LCVRNKEVLLQKQINKTGSVDYETDDPVGYGNLRAKWKQIYYNGMGGGMS
jgi:hypothetical protein